MQHDNPSALLNERIAAAGGALYEVGGSIRDELAGLPVKDRDYVVTGLPAADVAAALQPARVDFVGEAFGVFKVTLLDDKGDALTDVLDLALPRTERSTGAGHRDFAVDASHLLSIESDLDRRDFTINAMARRVGADAIIDPFGGQRHLRDRELVFVGNPSERVLEDPLRILRAFRMLVKLDLRVPIGQTRMAIRRGVDLIDHLPAERKWQELWGMLSYTGINSRALARALYWMLHDGVLERLIPQYKQAKGYDQGTPYHNLDLADHMIEAVAYAQHRGASPTTKLALLLHDLGKPLCRAVDATGRTRYFDHEGHGIVIADGVLVRLKAPLQIRLDVERLIYTHMRLSPRQPLGEKGLRRFMHDLGPLWRSALDHRLADLLAHSPEAHQGVNPHEWHTDLLQRGIALEANTQLSTFSDHTLAVTGADVMTLLGLKPGREVGRIKDALVQDVIDGTIPNERPALIARLKELHVPS